MPIWLRRFTFNVVKEFYDKEKEEYDKIVNKSKTLQSSSKSITPPIAAKPTYTTKAPKK